MWCQKTVPKIHGTWKCHKKKPDIFSIVAQITERTFLGLIGSQKSVTICSLVSAWLPFLCTKLANLCNIPMFVRACFDFERTRDRFLPQSSVFHSKLSRRSFEIIIFEIIRWRLQMHITKWQIIDNIKLNIDKCYQ